LFRVPTLGHRQIVDQVDLALLIRRKLALAVLAAARKVQKAAVSQAVS
jgi:hypothetical protein